MNKSLGSLLGRKASLLTIAAMELLGNVGAYGQGLNGGRTPEETADNLNTGGMRSNKPAAEWNLTEQHDPSQSDGTIELTMLSPDLDPQDFAQNNLGQMTEWPGMGSWSAGNHASGEEPTDRQKLVLTNLKNELTGKGKILSRKKDNTVDYGIAEPDPGLRDAYKNIPAMYAPIGIPVLDSAIVNKPEILFDSDEFIKTISSAGPATDINYILGLPAAEQSEFIKNAKQRALRIEFDDILIDDESETDGIGGGGGYIRSLNLIKLSRYVTNSGDPDTLRFVHALNNEIIFVFCHEYNHFESFNLDIRGLSFDEIVLFAIHLEISGRFKELVLRDRIYSLTNDWEKAFPKTVYLYESGLKRQFNPGKISDLFDMDVRGTRYIDWRAKYPGEPADISQPRANAMIHSAVCDFNIDAIEYINLKRIAMLVEELLKNQLSQLRSGTKGYNLLDFQTCINSQYLVGNNTSVFDLGTKGMREAALGCAGDFLKLKDLHDQIEQVLEKRAEIILTIANMQTACKTVANPKNTVLTERESR
jgi:hypothetical protein